MNALFPLIAALFQASALTLDKVILSARRVTFKGYTAISFPLIFFITLAIFLLLRPPLTLEQFSDFRWLLIAVSAALAVGGNLFFYRALDADRLGEVQTLDLLHNFPVIAVSSILFSDERNLAVLVPALAAAVAVVWSHWEGTRLRMARPTLLFLLFSLVSAPLAAAVAKILLRTWHPVSFELVRSGAMMAVLAPFFSRAAERVSARAFSFLLVTNLLTSLAWLLFFYSYQRSGIVYTLLLFSLQPLLVYAASLLFLKEPVQQKKLIAFGVVLVAIVTAQFMS